MTKLLGPNMAWVSIPLILDGHLIKFLNDSGKSTVVWPFMYSNHADLLPR